MKQLINQSINQSIYQINHCSTLLYSWTQDKVFRGPVVNQSTSQWIHQQIIQPINQPIPHLLYSCPQDEVPGGPDHDDEGEQECEVDTGHQAVGPRTLQ